jgi:hypothetical protein
MDQRLESDWRKISITLMWPCAGHLSEILVTDGPSKLGSQTVHAPNQAFRKIHLLRQA